ncbi:MAG: protease family protein [Acidimicrobiaceae bacterium]|nr:protease family protein [Acidimicrobiaceae bacterium]
MSGTGATTSGDQLGPPPDRARVPARGGWYVVFGLLGGIISGTGLGLIARAVAPHQFLLRLVPGQFALWACLIGACRAASHRYGTGRVARDFGLRARPADIGRGLLLSVLGRIVQTVVLIPILLANRRLIAGNTQVLHDAHRHWFDYVVVAVFAGIGAPIIEELFFRGLLLRVLEEAWGPVFAVIGQAVVFGLCHVNVLLGAGNVAVVVAIAAFGVVQGAAALRYRRLGPGIWSHAFFNLVAVVVIAARG